MKQWNLWIALLALLTQPFITTADWEAIGPENCSTRGIVQSLVSADLLFCMAEGIAQGGVEYYSRCMRSLDHGMTWEYMGDCTCSYDFLYSFAIGPTDVLFIGSNNVLHRSSDGGATWEEIQKQDINFNDLAAHPINEQVVRAAATYFNSPTTMAYLSSDDGGDNWDITSLHSESGGSLAIAVCPSSPNCIYVGGFSDDTARVFRSIDGGISFVEVSSPLWPEEDKVHSLAVHTTDPNVLFSGNDSGIYRTLDGGSTWSQVSSQTGTNCVAVSGANPLNVFCSHVEGVCRSSDGGITWEDCSSGLYGTWFSTILPSRSQDGRVFVCSTPGLFDSQNNGDDWALEAFSTSYGFVKDLEVRPNPPFNVYAIISFNSLFESEDLGVSWTPLLPAGSPVASSVAPDPFDPDVIFYLGGNAGDVYTSADGGESWTCVDSSYYWTCNDIIADPGTPGRYWTAGRINVNGDGAVSWTSDYGQTWLRLEPNPVCGAGRVVAVDPDHSDTVYAFFQKGGSGPWLARTFNAGSNWSFFFLPDLSWLPEDLVACPGQPGILYAACDIDSSAVAKSYDGGISWEGIAYDFGSAIDLQVDPQNPQSIYAAANSKGVWISQNGGETWFEMNDGLPADTYVRKLAIAAGQYAFCGGGYDGCFRWQLPLGVEEQQNQPLFQPTGLRVCPNPSTGVCTAHFDLAEQGLVTVDLFDLTGRKVIESIEGSFEAGSHEIQLLTAPDEASIPPGVYLVLLQTQEGDRAATRFVMLH